MIEHCAHVMTVIWYLRYAQYLDEDIHVPVRTASNIFVVLKSSDEEQEEG